MPNQLCSICLEPLVDNIGCLESCKHAYHLSCLREWHNHSHDKKCPICRIPSNKVKDLDNNVVIDIDEFYNLNQLISILSSGIDTLSLLEDDTPPLEMRPPMALLECGICGIMDSDIDKCCTDCRSIYHEYCLRDLLCEVGDRSSESRCSDCQGTLVNVTSSPLRYRYRGRNAIPRVLMEGPSLVTQRLYESQALGNTPIIPQTISGGNNAVMESWKLLSRLQEHQNEEIYKNKNKIQGHVRKSLDYYYHGSGKEITKDQYTEVNKSVSRNLYRISGNVYQPGIIDYDAEAHKMVLKELRRLGIEMSC